MCNLNELKPLPTAAIVRDNAGNLRKLRGKFRSFSEMYEYARTLGCTIVSYKTLGKEA